jgi:hypothetical protein
MGYVNFALQLTIDLESDGADLPARSLMRDTLANRFNVPPSSYNYDHGMELW